jgi:nicotinamide riboside transporter PnuC
MATAFCTKIVMLTRQNYTVLLGIITDSTFSIVGFQDRFLAKLFMNVVNNIITNSNKSIIRKRE